MIAKLKAVTAVTRRRFNTRQGKEKGKILAEFVEMIAHGGQNILGATINTSVAADLLFL